MTIATRTKNYRATVTSLDDPKVAELRRQCSEVNKFLRSFRGPWAKEYDYYRVSIRARLGRGNPFAKLYSRVGNTPYSSQRIRYEHAQYFDIYIHQEWKETAKGRRQRQQEYAVRSAAWEMAAYR